VLSLSSVKLNLDLLVLELALALNLPKLDFPH